MGNILSCDSTSDKIYKHSGFSSTITSSFSSPTTSLFGLAWTGSNVLSSDYVPDKIYKHSGFSSTIISSFSSPSTNPRGLAWDSSNVLSCDSDSDKIYKHSGFSSTITSSFSSPSTYPINLAWASPNVLSADIVSIKIYKHSGFSSTIISSFSSPSVDPSGLFWDNTNVLSADATSDKIYKHSGFTSTITSSFSSPSINPTGLALEVVASISPSLSPSVSPSVSPSASLSPSLSPSISPSVSPSASLSPSISPSVSPSPSPAPDAISIYRKSPRTDITRLISPNDFRIENNLTSEVDTCNFTVKKYGSRTYESALSEEIEVYDKGTKIFAGTIEKITRKTEGTKILLFDCQLKDYTHNLDRKLVKTDYTSKSPEYIINDILTSYTDGTFTQTNVATTGITVEYIKFDYKEPSKCFQELAELIGYEWYVDYNKDIHFFDKANGETAAFNVTDINGNCINKSLRISEDSRQIRNVIYVRGGEYVGDSRTDKVGAGDGTTKIFKLPYRYDVKPTVTVNAVSQTVGVDFIDSEDSYNCLWGYQEKLIRFKTAPASGDVVVTGSPLIAVLIKAQNNPSVLINGQYEYRIVDKKIKTKEAARRRAQAEMIDYAEPPEDARFQSYTSGMRAGMKVNINSAILNKNEDFIATKVVTTMLTSKDKFQYDITLTTKRTMGIIAYLQRQIALLNNSIENIEQEEEVLDVIISIEDIDSVTVSDSLLEVKTKIDNMYSGDNASDKIYKHSGFSSTITSSFSSPSTNPRGLAWRNIYNNQGYSSNVLSCDIASDKIYKHSGFTSTITSSFSSPSTSPYGLAWDSSNVLSCDNASDKIYKHSGFTSTITSSFGSPFFPPYGAITSLAWDGGNILCGGVNPDKIYKYSGFTSTIISSFSSPSIDPSDLAWDSPNVLSSDRNSNKIYKHSGFSSTIISSFSSPSTSPTGLAWDGMATGWNF